MQRWTNFTQNTGQQKKLQIRHLQNDLLSQSVTFQRASAESLAPPVSSHRGQGTRGAGRIPANVVLDKLEQLHHEGRRRSTKSEGQGFPGGAVVENLPANAGDTGLSPGPGRSHMLQSN